MQLSIPVNRAIIDDCKTRAINQFVDTIARIKDPRVIKDTLLKLTSNVDSFWEVVMYFNHIELVDI